LYAYANSGTAWLEMLAFGPDGNLWVADWGNHRVASFTTAGVETDFPLGGNVGGIAAGQDGNLWISGYPGGNPKVTRLVY
jgi:sugar lactone lactonase YvrE